MQDEVEMRVENPKCYSAYDILVLITCTHLVKIFHSHLNHFEFYFIRMFHAIPDVTGLVMSHYSHRKHVLNLEFTPWTLSSGA